MSKAEREDALKNIKDKFSKIEDLFIENDYVDVLNEMSNCLEDMISNNENHANLSTWETLKEQIEDVVNALEGVEYSTIMEYRYNKKLDINERSKAIIFLKHHFKFNSGLIEGCSTELENLRTECEEALDNCSNGGIVEQYKDDIQDMLDEIEEIEEALEPYQTLAEAIDNIEPEKDIDIPSLRPINSDQIKMLMDAVPEEFK